jgi:hypothetical protein
MISVGVLISVFQCASPYFVGSPAPGPAGDSESEESSGSGGLPRQRDAMSASQESALTQAYHRTSHPKRDFLEQLSMDTGLRTRTVQLWFQNKRAKAKRRAHSAGNLNLNLGTAPCGGNGNGESHRSMSDFTPDNYNKTLSPGNWNISMFSLADLSTAAVPPNVDLTCADIRNGEVCFRNNLTGNGSGVHIPAPECLSSVMHSWMSHVV